MNKKSLSEVSGDQDENYFLEPIDIGTIINKLIRSVIDDVYARNGFLAFAKEPNSRLDIELLPLLDHEVDKDGLYVILSRLTTHFAFCVMNHDVIAVVCESTVTMKIQLLNWDTFSAMFCKYDILLKLEDNVYRINLVKLFKKYYIEHKGNPNYIGITANPCHIGNKLINITPAQRTINLPKLRNNTPNPMLLGYIKSVMASRSDRCYNYLINWLRNITVNPYGQTFVCPIFEGIDVNSLFLETFVSCIYGNKYSSKCKIDDIIKTHNSILLAKHFVICDATFQSEELSSYLSTLDTMVVDDRIIMDIRKVTVDIFTCLNLCIITDYVNPNILGKTEFPVFTFSQDYENIQDINKIITNKDEMRKFIYWLKDENPIECSKMPYEHVVIDKETEYWNSLSFDEIIDMLEIDQLATESKRYGYRIDFRDIYDNYVISCNSYNQQPMHKILFYNNLRNSYDQSMNKELVYNPAGGHKSVLVRREREQE